jgi:hypothetical protein
METVDLNTSSEWVLAHQEVVSIGKVRAQHEHAVGKVLLRALKAECWKALGLGSFHEYAERYVGLTPRQTEERLRVATALTILPKLDAALAGGSVHFSTVRELSRVATPLTEAQWIQAVEGKSSREVEEMTTGRVPGDGPEDPARPEARRHRIVLEVSADTYATFREAQTQLRREHGGRLGDDELLLLMSRAVLGGPGDSGTSSYQIQMTLCESCGRASQDGGGLEVPVEATIGELAQCDAQRLRDDERAAQDIPPATRREVVRRHHNRCAVDGCRHATWTDVHHVTPRSEGGTHDPDGLVLLCSVHHKAVHRGALLIEGTYTTGFRFYHADGSHYGSAANPGAAGLLSNVFQVLRNTGFKESQARAIVDLVRPHVGAGVELADAVRMAFRASREMTMPA